MIGAIIRSVMISLLLAYPSWAFVEQLAPNGGGIPCHAIGATMRNFITAGGPSAAQIATIIEREWVPTGWTVQDNTDNAGLTTALNALSTQEEKERLVQRAEDYCILWEEGVDELDTPAEYRARLGINP